MLRPSPRALISLPALLALTLTLTTACRSTATADGSGGAPGAAAAPAPAISDQTKLCGTPPCMRFLSRSETRTLQDTFTNHPIASAVAVHVVGTLLCGGVLCLLGEGVGLVYVERETKAAAAANECLRVRILPSGAEWKVVDLAPSNESPYCT
jgi:hypothetical protein